MPELLLDDVLKVAGGLLAAFYLLAPLVVYLAQRQPAYLDLHPIELENRHVVPEATASFLAGSVEPLREAGFAPEATLFHDGEEKRPTIYLTLFRNPAAHDFAMAVAFWLQGQEHARHIEFATGLEGRGEPAVMTSNAELLPPYPPVPGRHVTQLPTVSDPRRLYRLHRALVDRVAGRNAARRLPPEPDAAGIVRGAAFRELLSQVGTGYMRLDLAANEFRPTLSGAFLMTWRLLPPVSLVRRLAWRRRAARLLRELSFA